MEEIIVSYAPVEALNLAVNLADNTVAVTVVEADALEVNVGGMTLIQVTQGGGAYQHNQTAPAATWLINHNLGFRPGGIVVLDTAGSQWLPEVEYNDLNSVSLHFGPVSFSGTAFIS